MGKSKKKFKNQSNNKQSQISDDILGKSNEFNINNSNFKDLEEMDPRLLKHIKAIQDINPKILIWNDFEIVDHELTNVLFSKLDSKSIKSSINASLFADYLNDFYLDQFFSNISTCGAVIKNKEAIEQSTGAAQILCETKIVENILNSENDANEICSDILKPKETDKSDEIEATKLTNEVSLSQRSKRQLSVKNYKEMANGECIRRLSKNVNEQHSVSQSSNSEKLKRRHSIVNSSPIITKNDNITSKIVKKQSQIKSKRKPSHINVEIKNCVACKSAIDSINNFRNLCKKCTEVMYSNLKHCVDINDLICINDPPCFNMEPNKTRCHACIVQEIISHGLQCTDHSLKKLLTVDVSELRDITQIDEARLATIERGQKYLDSLSKSMIFTSRSCLLSPTDDYDSICDWDINFFERITSISNINCSFCDESKDNAILYSLIRTSGRVACQNCILRAHKLTQDTEMMLTECVGDNRCDLDSCDACFRSEFYVHCPCDGIRFRFQYLSDLDPPQCRLCLRLDENSIVKLKCQVNVCVICLWRIKLFKLLHKEKCKHRTLDTKLTCSCCLVDLASRIGPIHEFVTQKIPKSLTNTDELVTNDSNIQEPAAKLKKLSRKTTNIKSKVPPTLVVESNENDTEAEKENCTSTKSQEQSQLLNESKLSNNTSEIVTNDDDNILSRKRKVEDTQIVRESSCKRSKRKTAKPAVYNDYVTYNEKNIADLVLNEKKSETQRSAQQESLKNDSIDFNEYQDIKRIKYPVSNSGSKQPRIKAAVRHNSDLDDSRESDTLNLDEALVNTVSKPVKTGPRVKNVSRQNVSDIILDGRGDVNNSRCVIKKVNRNVSNSIENSTTNSPLEINKVYQSNSSLPSPSLSACSTNPNITDKPASVASSVSSHTVSVATNKSGFRENSPELIVEDASSVNNDNDKNVNEVDKEEDERENKNTSDKNNDVIQEEDMRCGRCTGCKRKKVCGKCYMCKIRKAKGGSKPICKLWICRNIDKHPWTNASQSSLLEADETAKLTETPYMNGNTIFGATKPLSETYQPVPIDKSIEIADPIINNHDLDLDQLSLNTDQRVLRRGSKTLTDNGNGYAIVSTKRGAPSKVICYSCGSGGEHMLNCVSCAEPYHFFCIDLMFRPTRKELFQCRHCTQCNICKEFSSDLKCIKCLKGYHINCVGSYFPPANDLVVGKEWACPDCAMCIHCGAIAGHLYDEQKNGGGMKMSSASSMDDGNTGTVMIDWSDDPWQCAPCYKARQNGKVCVCCKRAFPNILKESDIDTFACTRCHGKMHKQCALLTEDEFAILQLEEPPKPVLLYCEDCSKKTSSKIRRGESFDKFIYAKINSRMKETIELGAEVEESLNNDKIYVNGSTIINQIDGLDEEDDDGDVESEIQFDNDASIEEENNNVNDNNNTNNNVSTESLNDVDLEQDDVVEYAPRTIPSNLPGLCIFSGLDYSKYRSSRHLLTDILARIIFRKNQYKHVNISTWCQKLIKELKLITKTTLSWVDFNDCLKKAKDCVSNHPTKLQNVLKNLTRSVAKVEDRETDVFRSTVDEIESKLSGSFKKTRDEFIEFHTETHRMSLENVVHNKSNRQYYEKSLYCKYDLAFPINGGSIGYGAPNYLNDYDVEDQSRKFTERDHRVCAMCKQGGDDDIEGRLLYGGGDVWVHVNCALWSDEVYEDEEGTLHQVDAAVTRGCKTECCYCGKLGATVSCAARDSLIDEEDTFDSGDSNRCSNVYHLGCAFNLLTDPAFTADNAFYCTEMHESVPRPSKSGRLKLSDMLILRRVMLTPGCLSFSTPDATKEPVDSPNVVITIGAMKINFMGRLDDEVSTNQRSFLSPIGYVARRLFWSTTTPDLLVLYFMTIRKEINKNYQNDKFMTVKDNNLFSCGRVSANVGPVNRQKRPRNLLETSDYKRAKKNYQREISATNNTIVYEMDDAGNLRIPSFNRGVTEYDLSSKIRKMNNYRPQNRRFPTFKPTLVEALKVGSNKSEKSAPVAYNSSSSKESTPVRIGSINNSITTNPSGQMYLSNAISPSFNSPLNNFSTYTHQPPPIIQPITNNSTPFIARIQDNKLLPIINTNHHFNANPPQIIRKQSVSSTTHTGPQKIIKITNIQRTNSFQNQNIIQTNNYQVPHINNVVAPQSHSVLRNVLKGGTVVTNHQNTSQFRTGQPMILSSGSINTSSVGKPTIQINITKPNYKFSNISQLDGEMGDATDDNDDTYSTISKPSNTTNNNNRYLLKFVVMGVSCSLNPKNCWSQVVKKVSQLRGDSKEHYRLRTMDGWTKFGLNHPNVVYLIELLLGAYKCKAYNFRFHPERINQQREEVNSCSVVKILEGCSRTTGRIEFERPADRVHDPLDFLRCKANRPPKIINQDDEEINRRSSKGLPIPGSAQYVDSLAKQYNTLLSGSSARTENVKVCVSPIHGRGLFALRDFEPHEVIIEYLGELIRTSLSDIREARYQRLGVDCYMFRLDRYFIVDATFKGNAARFINHSCRPNCYAKLVQLGGVKHIIIIALTKISQGEEMTYDYQFPYEEDKLPCTCGSNHCRKYLN